MYTLIPFTLQLPAEATVTVMLSENPLPATTPLPDRTYAVPLVPNSNLSHVIIDSLQLSASSGLTLTVSSQRQLLVDSVRDHHLLFASRYVTI